MSTASGSSGCRFGYRKGHTLSGRNQRLILNHLRFVSAQRWLSKEEIMEATGLKPVAFQRTMQELVRMEVVDQKVDPFDGRRRLYRRREIA